MKPRKPIKRKSARGRLVTDCDKLLFEIIKIERGSVCEICGRAGNVTPFHILPKGRYPRIRYHKINILICGWFCCHNLWHSDYFIAQERIEPKIKKLRGEDYKEKLLAIDAIAPRLSNTYLGILKLAFKEELKKVCK